MPAFLKHCWYHLVELESLYWATHADVAVAQADVLTSVCHTRYISRKADMLATGEQTWRYAMRCIIMQNNTTPALPEKTTHTQHTPCSSRWHQKNMRGGLAMKLMLVADAESYSLYLDLWRRQRLMEESTTMLSHCNVKETRWKQEQRLAQQN